MKFSPCYFRFFEIIIQSLLWDVMLSLCCLPACLPACHQEQEVHHTLYKRNRQVRQTRDRYNIYRSRNAYISCPTEQFLKIKFKNMKRLEFSNSEIGLKIQFHQEFSLHNTKASKQLLQLFLISFRYVSVMIGPWYQFNLLSIFTIKIGCILCLSVSDDTRIILCDIMTCPLKENFLSLFSVFWARIFFSLSLG